MYVDSDGDSYSAISNIIKGYNIAMIDIAQIDILGGFHIWLKQKAKKGFNIHSTDYILKYMAGMDRDKAKNMLLSLLEEYLNSIIEV